jgi:hypothetical protein
MILRVSVLYRPRYPLHLHLARELPEHIRSGEQFGQGLLRVRVVKKVLHLRFTLLLLLLLVRVGVGLWPATRRRLRKTLRRGAA